MSPTTTETKVLVPEPSHAGDRGGGARPHTAGRWVVEMRWGRLPVVAAPGCIDLIADFTWGWDDNPAEALANARLVAAAPCLLEALKNLYLKSVVGTDDERHDALNAAWAAIQRAEQS